MDMILSHTEDAEF